jgi:hypothetical protein
VKGEEGRAFLLGFEKKKKDANKTSREPFEAK